MKLSSHLYLRTDGTLGRFPIVEIDSDGRILSIVEHADGIDNVASLSFYPGVLIPAVETGVKLQFNSRESFGQLIKSLTDSSISVGSTTQLMVVQGFDLNSFDCSGASILKVRVKW